jgi:hypothetical protein
MENEIELGNTGVFKTNPPFLPPGPLAVAEAGASATMLEGARTNRSPYTEGPWDAPNNGRDGAVYRPDAPKGTLWRITDGVRGKSDEEVEANTRLIAAAPQLFALAQQANDILNPMHDCDPAIRAWLAQYLRVLAKVEGDDKFWEHT